MFFLGTLAAFQPFAESLLEGYDNGLAPRTSILCSCAKFVSDGDLSFRDSCRVTAAILDVTYFAMAGKSGREVA